MILDLGLEPFLTVRVHDWFSRELDKYSSFRDLGLSHMLAGEQGFEPQLKASKASVLPLDDSPMLVLHFSLPSVFLLCATASIRRLLAGAVQVVDSLVHFIPKLSRNLLKQYPILFQPQC